MVMGDLGMHPGFSEAHPAPPGPMSVFTEAQAAKVWGIGHATAVVDSRALEHDRQQVRGGRKRCYRFICYFVACDRQQVGGGRNVVILLYGGRTNVVTLVSVPLLRATASR